jgi:hypothetical protein
MSNEKKVLRNKHNYKGSGDGYNVSGNKVEWTGDSNFIVGDDAIVHGDCNTVIGKRARVYGSHNTGAGDEARVEGDMNNWKGLLCNIVSGTGNKLNGQIIVRDPHQEEEDEMQEHYQEVARAQNKKRLRAAGEDTKKLLMHPSTTLDVQHDKESTEKPCCICLTNESICAALPCMHKSYCVKCAIQMTFPDEKPLEMGSITCAVCREVISGIKRVY